MSDNTISVDDYKLDVTVKWCAGCGDHAILSTIKKVLPETGIPKEKVVFVSGIGCSSRFPYYINAYGFHSIHGRAPAIASGVKIANPELSVWVVTGDGDLMAIGGNHFIHILRRNINVNILLFNNKTYGLTKGQYSPTSSRGSITKTSIEGTVENPFNPGELTMGAQGTFFARVVDTNPKMMKEVFLAAAAHRGTSLVEILENCVIFNNKTHEVITARDVRDDRQIYLQHGKPMVFGKNKDKGIRLNGHKFEVVSIGKNGVTIDDLMVHNALDPDDTTHYMLTRMKYPDFPVAMGIIRMCKSLVYESVIQEQVIDAKKNSKIKSVNDLIHSGNIFEVE